MFYFWPPFCNSGWSMWHPPKIMIWALAQQMTPLTLLAMKSQFSKVAIRIGFLLGINGKTMLISKFSTYGIMLRWILLTWKLHYHWNTVFIVIFACALEFLQFQSHWKFYDSLSEYCIIFKWKKTFYRHVEWDFMIFKKFKIYRSF